MFEIVEVNGYIIDDAIIESSNGNIRVELISRSRRLDENFLYKLCCSVAGREWINVSIREVDKITFMKVAVLGVNVEGDEKVTVIASCQCVPKYDRHGNGAQFYVEYL